MNSKLVCSLTLLLTVFTALDHFCGTDCRAQEIGDRVIVIVETAKVLKEGEEFGEYPRGDYFYIENTVPNYFVISDKGEQLWIRHKDVALPTEAEKFFTARIEENPTAIDLVCRARVRYHLDEFDLAMEDLDRAEEMDDEIAHLYISRSSVYCERDEYELALEEIELAAELDPDHPTVLNIQGLLAYHYDDYEEAREFYNRCIEVNPSYSVAYSNRALLSLQEDDYEQVKEDYKRCLKASPCRSTGYSNYAWFLINYESDYETALIQLNKAIELNPKDGNARYYRADIYLDRDGLPICAR